MREALKQWLSLSQVKEIPYSLLILTNMLHMAAHIHTVLCSYTMLWTACVHNLAARSTCQSHEP